MKYRVNIFVIFFLACLTTCVQNLERGDSSTICRTDDVYTGDKFYHFKKKKYILYDVNIGEGFNLQREVLYRIALVVYYLNQENRNQLHYLVLPPWCYLTHWGRKTYDKIKWEFFFNLNILKNVIPIMEYSEYEKLFGSHSDYILSYKHIIGKFTRGNEKNSFHILDFDNCYIEDYKLKRNLCKYCDHKYSVVYSGNCTHMKGKKIECIEYFLITSFFVSTTLADIFHYDTESIFIKQGSNILVAFPNELFENNLEDVLLYNEDLIHEGNNFIKKNFKSSSKYLSCHLRYNDFRKIPAYDIPPISISILKLLYIMFVHNMDKIFISSDEKTQIKKIINKEFPQFKHFFFFYENDNLHTGQVAIIDQWISSLSEIFVGTIFSRFSMHIKWERYLIGKGEENYNLDLCGYNINTNLNLQKQYSNIKHVLVEEALQKLHTLYKKFAEKDRNYLSTICYDSSHNYPHNLSIYRRKYIPY
ncbi:GDP-fucose protein O-fucosyltransferase 2 [Plasmodium gonderi]|uniref:GDP-fucose protein O-fucosyltransferase 2 n=1 Tax=Plasmodium gonderi TaxID=77519 RepID=A0A1Y1JG22_PLAGO|nr:GDP-fucose protein O-fucosyltransferase 2 [Plasmodium gonderi]GAW80157.1 GDP-fucose protein O-fucosyltransferase 2 [Plasmodium gonderi]